MVSSTPGKTILLSSWLLLHTGILYLFAAHAYCRVFYRVRGEEDEEEGAGGDANLGGAMAMGVGVGVAGGVLSSTLHRAHKNAEQGDTASQTLGKSSKSLAGEGSTEASTLESKRAVGSEKRRREVEDAATCDKEYPPVNVTLKLLLDFKEAGEDGSIQRAGFQQLLVQVRMIVVM